MFLGLENTNIEEAAEDFIEIDDVDVSGDDHVADVCIVKLILEQHHLLQSASNSNDDDVGECFDFDDRRTGESCNH